MKDFDPNVLFEKFRISHEIKFKSKEDCVEAKLLLDELVRVDSISREEYNNFCTKSNF